ncbi:RidA family protein [Scatolibacter rhodanostii]|uniref:RidA family protein n=1 Tax=Scatolibacter rhodanostii TaxID=2014781 RepID=UPI000C078F8E|nr:RidA family protein [Scatolibacter rhodanostii]
MKKVIKTDQAPSAIGPYSQGIDLGNLVFTSGQIPLNPKTGQLVADDIQAAARQSMDNVKAVLEAAGTSLQNVIKTTVFVKDLNDFAAVNEVYGSYFEGDCPARSCVQVAKLPMDALVEIEAIAIK